MHYILNFSYYFKKWIHFLPGCVELFGPNQDMLLISAKDRPTINMIAVNARDRFHIKSVLNNPVNFIKAVPDGSVICGVIGTKICTWIVNFYFCAKISYLFSYIEMYRNISKILLNVLF